MIESCALSNPHIAGWNDGGDTLIVYSPQELEKEYLPRYFQHSNFQSFVRQLNLYGFKNVTKDAFASESTGGVDGMVAFRNSFFVRDRRDLVEKIQRSKTGDRSQRRLKQDEANNADSKGLKGRLDSIESEVRSLHQKIDGVSEQLNFVINMLASTGLEANPGIMKFKSKVPQSTQNSSGMADRSAGLIDASTDGSTVPAYEDSMARSGSKRLFGIQVDQKRKKQTKVSDGKVISSDESYSSLESFRREKRRDNRRPGNHSFYDVDSLEACPSPLDDNIELDTHTSSVLMTLAEDNVLDDETAGMEPVDIEFGSGSSRANAARIQPISLRDEEIELPDIFLGDAAPGDFGGGVHQVTHDNGICGLNGKRRNFLYAGLLLTMVVAVGIGAGLSLQREAPPRPIPEDESFGISAAAGEESNGNGGNGDEDQRPGQQEEKPPPRPPLREDIPGNTPSFAAADIENISDVVAIGGMPIFAEPFQIATFQPSFEPTAAPTFT